MGVNPCWPKLSLIGVVIRWQWVVPNDAQGCCGARCGGIVEVHWNGSKWVDVETRVEGAKSMTWQGRHPIVALSRQVYQKGVMLRKRAMRAVEARLERHPELPYWDILIRPAALS